VPPARSRKEDDVSTETAAAPHGRQLALSVVLDKHTITYPLPPHGEVVIGRDVQVACSFGHHSLSRRHAIVRVGDGDLTIEDLGSKNGTYVGGRRLAPAERYPLGVGCSAVLGSLAIVVVAWGTSPAAAGDLWGVDALVSRLEYECARARRSGRELALLRLRLRGPAAEAQAAQVAAAFGSEHPVCALGAGDFAAIVFPHQVAATRARLAAALANEQVELRDAVAVYGDDGRTAEQLLASSEYQLDGLVRTGASGAPILVIEPAMVRLHLLAERAAATDASVLLLGETGAGKEILAETIHRASPRRDRPLLRLNCAAFSETLLESELFGHEKGSFSGAVQAKPGLLETAHGGTVFLDEIGELPLGLQAKLLRVLESGEILRIGGLKPKQIDVRFIAATNRDLLAESRRGAFRVDLYYRLNGVSLAIPPLRERPAEIEALAVQFLERLSARLGRKEPSRLTAEAIARLKRYRWPGNVRELRNVIQRALVLCGDSPEISPEHLELDATCFDDPEETERIADDAAAPTPEVDERQRVTDALRRCAGNQSRAAKLLGMSRTTLIKRMLQYGLRGRDWFAD